MVNNYMPVGMTSIFLKFTCIRNISNPLEVLYIISLYSCLEFRNLQFDIMIYFFNHQTAKWAQTDP